MSYRIVLTFFTICYLLGAARLRAADDIPDPDPELERQTFQLPEGFEVNLWAADPLLAKPIQMNFDAAGRLWIATSEIYPQVKPGEVANDKILVLEDTDQNGQADKTTIFAGGLLIPTGVEPTAGGAYVANSTEVLLLRDTNGDLKADNRQVILSGFGTEDTHHIIHTFRWGFDGSLFFNQSVYIHSHVETPWGPRRLNGGGTWRFRPASMQLDVVTRGLINHWGHHWDRWGATFLTDGAGGEGINCAFPGVAAVHAPGIPRVLAGLNPGSPKFCGLELVSGRHMPDDWQGSLITNDFRGHRVCRFVVTDDGAGFASREQPELVKSTHPAFRPIDVKMGPDGAIYIADWYNPIINHGEVDFRDPRRDKVHGRIWRVTAKGRALVDRPQLINASPEQLLEQLKSPEEFTRHFAKRQLIERGVQVVPALAAWVKSLNEQDADYEHHLLEALWTYESLDVVEPALLERVLTSKDFRARATASRTLGHWLSKLPNGTTLLARQITDEHPRVRLEAICAARALDSPETVEIAVRAIDRPIDRFIDHALWITIFDLQPKWLPALQAGKLTFGGNAKYLSYLLETAATPAAIAPLVSLLQSGQLPAERRQNALVLIAAHGAPNELATVWQLAADAKTDPATSFELLAGLRNATQNRKVAPAGDLSGVVSLLTNPDQAVRMLAIQLAGAWHVEAARSQLNALATAASSSEAESRAAIEAIAALSGPASRDQLTALASPPNAFARRATAIAALAHLDVSLAVARAVELLTTSQPANDPSPMITALVEQKDTAASLAAALAGKQLQPDVARMALRGVRASGRDEPSLVTAIAAAGGIAAASRAFNPDELKQVIADVATQGDPVRGEEVFRRAEHACLKCHAIGDAGGQVGPNLQSLGASAPVDYLVESLLQPVAKIKEGYHSLNVTTNEGKVLSGVKLRETADQLVLRDAEDHEITIPKASIDEQTPGGSLMPVGLTDTLTRSEFVDLVRFISELGKVGSPYAVGKERLVRRWMVLTDAPLARQQFGRVDFESRHMVAKRDIWRTAYSQVSGTLPVAELPVFDTKIFPPKMTLVDFQLDVSTPGFIAIKVDPTVVCRTWQGSYPVELRGNTLTLDLKPGRHTVTLGIDGTRPNSAVRAELVDVPGSTAQAQLVGGK
jgi:putative heme-binding domain-containing protein